jgi:hypothetical protein
VLCFDVRLNAERIALAGVREGVLSAILTFVSRPSLEEPELSFEIGGLVEDAHLQWAQPSVKIGDRIEIRIVEADNPDGASRKPREDKAFQEQSERRYFDMLKQKYGW